MNIVRQPLFHFGIAKSADEILTVCRIAGALPATRGRGSEGGLHLEEADHCYAKESCSGEVAAVMILTYPSARRARAEGSATGLPFARTWHDSSLATRTLAQMSLIAVAPRYLGKPAAAVLHEGFLEHASRRGLGAVVGTVSLETRDAFHAGLATLAARKRGAIQAEVWLEARTAPEGPKRLYTSAQLHCLNEGLARLHLPYQVQRCIGLDVPVCGEPVPDEETGIYRIPFLASLQKLANVA